MSVLLCFSSLLEQKISMMQTELLNQNKKYGMQQKSQ